MTASVNLDYYSNDLIDVAFDITGRFGELRSPIQSWSVELRVDDPFNLPTTLARASVFVVPHAMFRDDIPTLVHEAAPNLDVIAVDITEGGNIPAKLLGDGESLLLIENVVVAPEHRGRNLGHMIVSAAQTFLLRDGHGVTALLPRPTEGAPAAAGELKLSRYWREMGFVLHGASLVMTQ